MVHWSRSWLGFENPARSWLWHMPEVSSLLSTVGAYDVLYDACMWGGSRKKAQRLRTNMAELRSLGLSCNGDHPHLPWQQGTSFATSMRQSAPKCCAWRSLVSWLTCKAGTAASRPSLPFGCSGGGFRPVPQAVLARKANQKSATGHQPRAGKLLQRFQSTNLCTQSM